eukprot:g7884.t1
MSDDDAPTQTTWQCTTCFKVNQIENRKCITCKRPCPEATPFPKKKIDRFGSMIDHMISSSEDEDDLLAKEAEEERKRLLEENKEKQRKLQEQLEADRKKKKFIDPKLHWTCKICGVKDNVNASIKCKICGRAKPGEEANVDPGPKRKARKRIIWPDSRRIARRVFVKWNMHNGKKKKGKEVVFDCMGSDDPIKRVCERIEKHWKIPIADQSITAKSFKRKLPMDMELDELDFTKDVKQLEVGPAFVLFLATFRISKRALANRKKKSKWAKVNTKVKSIANFDKHSTVKLIQHFKLRGE